MGISAQAKTVLSIPDLSNPKAFADWWHECHQLDIAPLEIAKMLEAVGTSIALVRASQVLTRDPKHSILASSLAGRSLQASDHDVRLLARLRLATLEVMRGYRVGTHDVRGAFSAVPVLLETLEACDLAHPRTDLIIETELRTRKSLAEAYLMTGEYEAARGHLSHSLVLAQGLGLESFVHHTLFLLGVVLFHAGSISTSTATLERVASDPRAETIYAWDASLVIAMNALWQGDDDRALAALKRLSTQSKVYALYADCALAITGRGGLEADFAQVRAFFANEMMLTFQAYTLLIRANGRRSSMESESFYRELRVSLEHFRTTTVWLEAECGFLRCLASLRLGEFGLARQQYPAPEGIPTEHVALRALVLGLGLELGLHVWNSDVRPLADLSASLQRLLLNSSPPVRTSLAQRFKVFLPLAGAFLAYSPYSVSEFVSACGPAVLNLRSKPVKVYDTSTLRPLHAVRYTLEVFGYVDLDYRDGGGQLEAEEQALRHVHGSRQHWFTPVPPALLVYQFSRQHQLAFGQTQMPSNWNQAAHDLVRSHGLLPVGARGFRERERKSLGTAFRRLMHAESNISDFLYAIRPEG
jgi:hypothetical protein